MFLHVADLQIELIDEGCLYKPSAAPNKRRYQTVHYLDGIADYESSAHGIRVFRHGSLLASTVLLAGAGASRIHQHSGVIGKQGRSLLLAVGPYVACCSIPT